MITKELLEERIALLKQQEQQHLAAANAANGAIQFAEHLLSTLMAEETKPEEKVLTEKELIKAIPKFEKNKKE